MYTVEILNADREIVGQTTSWLDLDLLLRFNGIGTWAVSLNGDDRALSLLAPGGSVVIRRGGEYLIGGPLRSLQKRRSREEPNGKVTVAGASFDLHLMKLCFPAPASAVDTQDGQVYDTRTGVAETVIYGYVNANAGPGALADRQVPGLVMGSDLGRGSTVTGNADFDILTDLISTLALTDGLGWRVVPDGTGLEFQVYQPADLTAEVRFGWELGNVLSYDWTQKGPEATREIIAGQGVGVWRLFRQATDATAETDWGVSLEKFVDRRDTNDDDVLTQAGVEALAEDAPGVQATFEAQDTAGCRFGEHWRVGDAVTATVDGVEYADVVREVHLTVGATGESITPTVGKPGASDEPWPYRGIRKALQAIQTQQRRR